MIKPQEKYEEEFSKASYPDAAERLREDIVKNMDEVQIGYLEELVDIIYCCGYTDGYDEARFFYGKIR